MLLYITEGGTGHEHTVLLGSWTVRTFFPNIVRGGYRPQVGTAVAHVRLESCLNLFVLDSLFCHVFVCVCVPLILLLLLVLASREDAQSCRNSMLLLMLAYRQNRWDSGTWVLWFSANAYVYAHEPDGRRKAVTSLRSWDKCTLYSAGGSSRG